jgi:hypothetical protein
MTGLVLPFQPPGAAAPAAGGVTAYNGIVPVVSARQLMDEEKAQTALAQSAPMITGLAGHVRRCFDAAVMAKREGGIEDRLNKAVRQRRGQYEPEVLAEIQKMGGSQIYMMLSANKARAAGSWIKDVMNGTRNERPWDVEPTAEPSLSPQDTQDVVGRATQEAMQIEQTLGVNMMNPDIMRDVVQRIADRKITDMKDQAERRMDKMRSKMEDQLQEGGFYQAMDAFIDDLVTFPYAIMKGPVIRKRKRLAWVQGQGGDYTPDVQETLETDWERVDPFKAYWAPHATEIDQGFFIEHHELTRSDIEQLIGAPGYDEGAIRAVLDEHGRNGLRDWLLSWNRAEQATAEGKGLSALMSNPDAVIDALQFWGNVQGKMLVEWGMDEQQVPDQLKEYSVELWVIGNWTIKAELNANPLGGKPYYKTSYEKIPGCFAGNGVMDLTRDTQNMCNAAARALSNNMGISSGPMTWVNTTRMAPGEDVTQMYPWRIFQGVTDPYTQGTPDKPIEFFQPQSNAQELMLIYDKFSQLADEYSGVPRYMTGDGMSGGAGRTASGMSMMMGNAGKSIKQVIGNIDLDVTEPLIDRLYTHNMRFADDPELKGDVRVRACGVNMLVAKESAQLRMNEILQIVANSELLIGIVGEEAVANLLREITKPLNMDIVPGKEIIRARMIQRQQMAMAQQIIAERQQAQQGQVIEGQSRRVGGEPPKTMPGNKQRLANHAPVTDNFSPSRRT